MTSPSLDRRQFLGSSIAGAAALAVGGSPLSALAQGKTTTVGIIYVGPRDDYGWNQAHAVAAGSSGGAPPARAAAPAMLLPRNWGRSKEGDVMVSS